MAGAAINTFQIEVPNTFSFRATVYGHGWSELAPFELDVERWRLNTVFRISPGEAVAGVISEENGRLKTELARPVSTLDSIISDVRHMLRLDDDLSGLYEIIAEDERLRWMNEKRAGRLLRSATVFEDLVKTICTTNCSWALTKKMVGNLVEKLGAPAIGGGNAFPTPQAMASVSDEFYRSEIKAGYRSPYFAELAEAVASGKLDPEAWLTSGLSTDELKKEMKAVKGVGNYAAENLLKLVGRYEGLALDSWLRSQFYKNHNNQRICADKKIERHYKKFGPWRGLVIWCDMTDRRRE